MAPIAILFGVLLTLLGGGVYAYSLATEPDRASMTSLIPAFFGISLIVLGVVARDEKKRMHAMHGAAMVGLIGFAIPAAMVILALIRGQAFQEGYELRHGVQSIMAVLCAIFVGWCVKSFIDARKARKAREAQTPAAPQS